MCAFGDRLQVPGTRPAWSLGSLSHLDDSDSGRSPLTHPLAEGLVSHLEGTPFPKQIAV